MGPASYALSADQLQLLARLSAYVAAFRALHPHHVTAMLPQDATGCLERTALLHQADFSACRQLSYNQQCSPCCNYHISDASAKAPCAFSGHHQGNSPGTCTTGTATTTAGTGAALNFVGTSSSMARHGQLSPSSHLVSSSLGLWQAAHSRCSDRPASHHKPPSATSDDPIRACI